MVNSIQSSLDNKLEVRSVDFDISKAFDKVWHEGLLFKLKQNGIEGNLLVLLKNYLGNRKQRVVINGAESEWSEIEAGVTKGSVHGPSIFLIYINDLENGIKSQINFLLMTRPCFLLYIADLTADDLNHDLNIIFVWAFNQQTGC